MRNQESNFHYIWNRWIRPLVNTLYKQMDSDFVSECNATIRNMDDLEGKAETFFLNKRSEAKQTFYSIYTKGDSEIEHRMDFHKIGAILCRTLIEYKLVDFDVVKCNDYVDKNINKYDTDWVVKNALINYRIAFYSSVVLLYYSILFLYSDKDKDLCDKLEKKQCLDLYTENIKKDKDTSTKNNQEVKESFENCMVLNLAKRNIKRHSFDYFMYSTILYQLEEHNIDLIKLKQNTQ